MSSTTPYIGSKISLISKAEIRYEGILYGIDATESTVTLAKVTSFGTEDRNAPKRIPASSEVYEYIIFRGSDIKDIHVKPQEVPVATASDPAIVTQSPVLEMNTNSFSSADTMRVPQLPTSMAHLPSQLLPSPGQDHVASAPQQQAVFSSSSALKAPGAPTPGQPSTMPSISATALLSSTSTATVVVSATETVSTSGAAAAVSEKTPPQVDIDTVVSTKANDGDSSNSQVTSQSTVEMSSLMHQQTTSVSTSSKAVPTTTVTQQGGRGRSGRARSGSSGNSRRQNYPSQYYSHGGRNAYDGNYYYSNYYDDQAYYQGQQAGWGYYDSNQRNYYRGSRGNRQAYRDTQGGGQRTSQATSTPSSQTSQRGQWSRKGGQNSSRGTQANRSTGQARRIGTGAAKSGGNAMEFDGDFDFESANAKFKKEEMEEEFKQKLKISESRKESESDNQTGEEEDVVVDEFEEGELVEEPPTVDSTVFYDSSKSFFDAISCESNQSSTTKRPSRNEERSLNTETFGQSTSRSGRSNRDRRGGSYHANYQSYYSGGGSTRGRSRGGHRGRGAYKGGQGQYGTSRTGNRTSQEQL